MKILVIGGSSFSGKHFMEIARNAGHSVVDLSRPVFDLNIGLTAAAAVCVRVSGCENVVNFAALNMVGESWKHAPDYYRTNVVGVSTLVSQLSGLRKFVQVSTPEVYGTTQTFLKEDAAFNPSTPYANSRAAADAHLSLMHRETGFPVCFTRTVNVYGPGQQLYRIIPKTALSALIGRKLPLHGGGRSTRSFIHIKDAMNGVMRVLEDGRNGETYHISTSVQTSIRDLVKMVCDRCDKRFEEVIEEVEERPGKDMAYQLDDSKIRTELGWADKISLKSGLDETVDWIKHNLSFLRTRSMEYIPPEKNILESIEVRSAPKHARID
jgi:dTDP-glucose 4,6-dehydratase